MQIEVDQGWTVGAKVGPLELNIKIDKTMYRNRENERSTRKTPKHNLLLSLHIVFPTLTLHQEQSQSEQLMCSN